MNKLTINHKETYNCFQFLVATLAGYYKKDFRLMMLELWGFAYEKSKKDGKLIGEKLHLCWNSKLSNRKQLLKYHGLDLSIINKTEFDLFEHYIKNRDELVAVYIDSYLIPWIPFYKKIHRPHVIIVTRIENEQATVLDQYTEGTKINLSFINENAMNYIVLRPCSSDKRYTLDCYIKQYLKSWDNYCFDEYDSFMADMINEFDLNKELGGDPTSSKLIMYLKCLSDDRLNFIEAIELFQQNYKLDLIKIKENLKEISLMYAKLRVYLIKSFYMKRECEPLIIKKELNNIKKLEVKVYKSIKKLVKET